jgi:hypothetical protein
MEFQTNGSGNFLEEHCYILLIYLNIVFGNDTFQRRGRKQN